MSKKTQYILSFEILTIFIAYTYHITYYVQLSLIKLLCSIFGKFVDVNTRVCALVERLRQMAHNREAPHVRCPRESYTFFDIFDGCHDYSTHYMSHLE